MLCKRCYNSPFYKKHIITVNLCSLFERKYNDNYNHRKEYGKSIKITYTLDEISDLYRSETIKKELQL